MIDFNLGIYLKDLEYSDTIRSWRNDPKIWRWTRQNDLLSKNHHEDWFEKQAKDPTIKMYGVHEIPTIHTYDNHDEIKTLVGVCGLTSINLTNRNAEFSLYIAPERQGNGLAKPALKTLLFHGFKNMNLHMIWGETFGNNPAEKMFRDIGMHQDGLKRQCYFKDGSFWDAFIFTILKDEFISLHEDRSCFI